MKIVLIFLTLALLGGCVQAPLAPVGEISRELNGIWDHELRLAEMIQGAESELALLVYNELLSETRIEGFARVKEIFNQYGYLGEEEIGYRATFVFHALILHSGASLAFQERVLSEMEPSVFGEKENAYAYAWLLDTVELEKNGLQVYGTSTVFERSTGKNTPLPIAQAEFVDDRREKIGLSPLWRALNQKDEINYSLETYREAETRLVRPIPYQAGFSDW